MKYIVMTAGLLALLCGSGLYSQTEKQSIRETRALLNEMINIVSTYNKKILGSRTEDEFVKMVDLFIESYLVSAKKMSQNDKNHPEFRTSEEAATALKKETERLEKEYELLADVINDKNKKFKDSQKVQNAVEKLVKALEGVVNGD
jgi:hypothetical protein